MAANGKFVIVWHNQNSGDDVDGQLYAADGSTIGGEFRINQNLTDVQDEPTVAMDATGNYIVAWRSNHQDLSGGGIFARRYDSSGNALTGEFQVNTIGNGNQSTPSVAMNPSGTFVITWASDNVDGNNTGVAARLYNASGVAQGNQFLVNTYTQDAQDTPAVAMDSYGAFTITWASNNQDGDQTGVYAQQYDSTGTKIGSEYRISSTTSGQQSLPAIAMGYYGDYVIAWMGKGLGDDNGVFGQFYPSVDNAPVNTLPATQSTMEDTPITLSGGNTISISDSDAGTAPMQITLTGGNGVITLGTIAGLTFTTGDGTADATMVFTGSISAVNAALNGLSFSPNANFNGAATIQIATNDQGNHGTGGPLTTTNTLTINVSSVNDAPVNNLPASQTINEDNPLVFSSGNGNLLSITDVDAGAGQEIVTLTATHGVLTLSGISGLTFTAGDGTADTTMTFKGTVANINAALNGLLYHPDQDYNGAATISINTNDQGFSGAGGALSDSDTLNITINPVNDAPVLAGTNNLTSINEDDTTSAGTLVSSLIAGEITEVDASPLAGIAVTAVDNTNGAWQYSTNGGTSWLNFGSPTGTSARLLASDANTRVRFVPNANWNGTVSGITFRPLGSDQRLRQLNRRRDRQRRDHRLQHGHRHRVDRRQSRSTTRGPKRHEQPGDDQRRQHHERRRSRLQFDCGQDHRSRRRPARGHRSHRCRQFQRHVAIHHRRWNHLAQLRLAHRRQRPAAAIRRQHERPLRPQRQLQRHRHRPHVPSVGSNQRLSRLNRRHHNQRRHHRLQHRHRDLQHYVVNAVNDAPVNTVPPSQTTNEDQNLVFSSGNGNQISVADVDVNEGTGILKITLSVSGGTLSLNGIAGLTFTTGDGTADVSMVFTGTVANINAALNGLTYAPTPNYNGSDTLSITTNDQGNTGAGGALSDTDTVGITINPVNDAPVLSGTNNLTTINEDNTTNAGTLVSTLIAGEITEVDANPLAGIAVTSVDNTNGTWQYTLNGGTTWLNFGAPTATTARLLPSDANTRVRFVPNANFNGTVAGITFRAWDQTSGTAGSTANVTSNGGTTAFSTATATASIVVNAVNDAPINTVPGPQTTNEDQAIVFSNANGNAISVSDVDVDEGTGILKITLSITNGLLSLSGISGLTFTTGDGTSDATMTFTGTVAAINTALDGLTYMPTQDYNGPATVQITTDDQGNTGAGGPLTDTDTVNVTVNPVNDAPVLGGTNNLTTINEDDTTNPGTPVSDLIAGEITEVDAAPLAGIAVTAVDNSNGTWQYTTDGGTTWLNFGSPSAANARLLAADANTRIRFVPNANYNGTVAGITFRAWDQTTGIAGSTADTTTNGGTTAFSIATATASITVNAINDAPVNTVPVGQTINEDQNLVFSNANGNAISIGDVDVDEGTGILQVTLTVAHGKLSLSGITGLTFTTGDGTSDASMTFTGTAAEHQRRPRRPDLLARPATTTGPQLSKSPPTIKATPAPAAR